MKLIRSVMFLAVLGAALNLQGAPAASAATLLCDNCFEYYGMECWERSRTCYLHSPTNEQEAQTLCDDYCSECGWGASLGVYSQTCHWECLCES